MSKAELIKRAKVYFDKDNTIDVMYVTDDGNLFYPHAEKLARNHAQLKNINCYKITRADLEQKKEVKKTTTKKKK